MVGLTQGGELLSWGRACNGRLGSDVPAELLGGELETVATAATAAAVARCATPPSTPAAKPATPGAKASRGVSTSRGSSLLSSSLAASS